MKKILIIGANGLLGSETTVFFRKYKYNVVTVDKTELNITDIVQVKNFLQNNKPDVIINCAAFTNVDACETSTGKDLAMQINGQAPIDLVRLCLDENITCMHISTDYVFGDGSEMGHVESDIPEKPINVYGATKLKAEQGIIELCGGLNGSDFLLTEGEENSKIYIIRISWLFGKNSTNFVQKIINKSKEVEELKVVDDEVGCPTYTRDVVEVIKYLLENDTTSGIFHVCSSSSCSRYEFAKYILEKINANTKISKCSIDDFDREANIPKFSILLNTKLPLQRDWREMVDEYYRDYILN